MPDHFENVLWRADHLKIPRGCPWGCGGNPISRMCIHVHRPSGGIGSVTFDCASCKPDNQNWIMVRPSFLAADCFRGYDKTGGKMLVDAIKIQYFGSASYRITEQRAVEFFRDDANFLMPAQSRAA